MEISRFQLILGGVASKCPQLMHLLGKIESAWLNSRVSSVQIKSPVFITGLARSGTTILLDLLAQVPGVGTHRYKDFPLVHIPYWWNGFLHRAGARQVQPKERAHQDGMYVTPDSPEAMEELVWMSFFPACHDPAQNNVFPRGMHAPKFETFYTDHIRKVLFMRQGTRYVSKGNYNITRLQYIHSLFPEAKFLIPIREPAFHIASLRSQHELFYLEESQNSNVMKYMQRAGHYEFGLDRRPINCGHQEQVQRVQALWNEGREVDGWAAYWAMIHDYLLQALAADPMLAASCKLVSYSRFCSNPDHVLKDILSFCSLDLSSQVFEQMVSKVRNPTTRLGFSDAQLQRIEQECSPVYSRIENLIAKNYHPTSPES